MNYIKVTPRETTPGYGTRVTSWWLDGSRERTGQPLFISEGVLFKLDGSEVNIIQVWVSNRPHGINEKWGVIEGKNHWLLTWADVENAR